MRDPFGSLQGMIGQFQGFLQNPTQFMIQRKLNIPPEYMKDTNTIVQYLMNTGQMTQADYDRIKAEANKIEHNPQFIQFINGLNNKRQ